jgi:hypothetical protein
VTRRRARHRPRGETTTRRGGIRTARCGRRRPS